MKSVFLMQWQRLRRAPLMVVSFFALTILFVSVMGGLEAEPKLTVYTYSDEELSEQLMETWLEKLNEADTIEFVVKDESEARTAVARGDVGMALKLFENDYRILVAVDDPNRYIVENFVQQIFIEELRLREVEARGVGSDFRAEVERAMADPVLNVVTYTVEGEGLFKFNNQLHALFGMTFYFSIFTIMFSLTNVVQEKRLRTWDRLILSPLRKWQVYLGHLFYCFTIGYAQITIIFLIFKFGFGFELGDRFGTILIINAFYTFAIVALGMLIIGLVRTIQQLQAVIPIVATAMAMLGGAYWPIEIVTNEMMLAAAKVTPVLYGLEALKGAAYYGNSVVELAQPISIMLLFGVICMGVGVNLMERR